MTVYRHWLVRIAIALVAVALLVACGGPSSSGSAPVADGPRISIPEDTFDFGKVPLDKLVSHSFTIKNVGSKTLVILGEPPVRAVQGC